MDNKRTYIRPEVEAVELPAPCLLLDTSDGTPDDPLDGIVPRGEELSLGKYELGFL